MTVDEIFSILRAKNINLSLDGEQLVLHGEQGALDAHLISLLRENKSRIIDVVARRGRFYAVPANAIPPASETITPEMLPLVVLDTPALAQIAAAIPGGAPNIQDIYPLAPLQEGILFHHLLESQGDPYLLNTVLGFDTRSQVDRFVAAMQSVIDRHDILRTAFLWEGLPEAVQVVLRQAALVVEEVVLDPGAGEIAQQLTARFNPRQYRLDVRGAPLLRVAVAQDGASERWVMVLLIHHLVIDHASLDVLLGEVRAHLRGEQERLPQPLPFRNFVAQARLGVSREEHETFFREMLGDVREPTVPFGLSDVQGDGSDVAEARCRLDLGLVQRLRGQARALGVSTASVCHVAWARVLAAVSGQDDVVFGTVLFGRLQGGEAADSVLGLFINTLPLRIRIDDRGVRDCVWQTHQRVAQLLHHEHASLALAQRCSGVAAPAPLFTALLNYRHNAAVTAREQEAFEGITSLGGGERTNYPVTLSVDDFGDALGLSAQVQSPLDPQQLCALMAEALGELVSALERAPQTAVRALGVLPPGERERMVAEWNTTPAPYPADRCLHELFEAQVARTPDAVAVVYDDAQLSYGELNAQANRLAHYLRTLGVGPDSRVALCVERSLEMVVGLLAILKAGGAYVPLDPSYPLDRLAYMLEDSAPSVVLAHGLVAPSVQAVLDRGDAPVIAVDRAGSWSVGSAENPPRGELTPAHLGYLIYTSGSTGRPKAVMVQHANVVRLFESTQGWFEFGADDVWTLFHSCAFDFSVWEMWGALFHGGRLVIVPQIVSRSPPDFYELLCERGVTVLNQTPSAFRELVAAQAMSRSSHRLRHVIFGGEALDTATLKPWYDRAINGVTRLTNMYGITETTVHVTRYEVTPKDCERHGAGSPIGRRIPDLRIYIVDEHLEPVPIGVAGELYIGGAGVARGYWNRPELTAQRFIASPFVEGDRLYKTGDVARYLPDGNIEFLGRNDLQVKIRGFRVELGEIESRLATYAGIRDVVVVAREDMLGEKRLVAYYVAGEGAGSIEAEQLRAHLQRTLPEYMVPAAYVPLEALPLTPNAKLDRDALPAPDDSAFARRTYEAPQNEVERTLARIWSEVLGIEQVGRYDNFFELGGHSLLVVRVIDRMRTAGLHADVRTLFTASTLVELAGAVRAEAQTITIPPNGIVAGSETITPQMLPLIALSAEQIAGIVANVPGGARNVQDIYPLAPLQEGILFHHLLADDGDPYVLYALYRCDSRKRMEQYLAALQAVIDRHDILRTSVVWEGLPEAAQVVWRSAPLIVEEVALDPADGEVAQQLAARYNPRHYRLDVRRSPMMHVACARESTGSWLMVHLFHHLVLDHMTLEIVQHEIDAYLHGSEAQLPEPLPFRNLVAHARLGVSREEHETFFRTMLQDVSEPTLPFELADVQGDGRGIVQAYHPVDSSLSKRLRACARRLGVSAASVCHVAWARVLAVLCSRDDVVFGTVLFGRMQGGAGADRIVGLSLNTLPLRVKTDTSVEVGVRRAHEALAQLMYHEHAPLALAQRCSGVTAPAPLFSALLNYRHFSPESVSRVMDGIEVLGGQERTNYPVALSVNDFGEELSLSAQAHESIAQRTCEYMHRALEELVDALEHSPEKALSTLRILPDAERHRVLVEWNATERPYRSDLCIHELFEEQVERTPDAVALVYQDAQLSYAELNHTANQLARYLRTLGVGPESRVAICVERSVEMVVGLLAVLKAGGAYVPLDPSYPLERLAYMLQDSAPVAVLTHDAVDEAVTHMLTALNAEALDLNKDAKLWSSESTANPRCPVDPTDLAYVFYTSGSTGTPKGVMMAHRACTNRISTQTTLTTVPDDATFAQKTALGFLDSFFEMLSPLGLGHSLAIVPPSVAKDTKLLVESLRKYRVTNLVTVPSLAAVMEIQESDLPRLRSWTLSGEAISGDLARRLKKSLPQCQFVNLYGSTEACADATRYEISGFEREVPIGHPIANMRAYVLDDKMEPVPIGVRGELYVGGAGVARGYLNRAELTAERFVASPFVAGDRLYKTGDVARHLPDGNIEFLGRNDFQVKIRGFRIELGEIESRLVSHEVIREAVVVAREDVPGEKRLVAYYVAEEGAGAIEAEQLRARLQRTLPEYMVPAAYVALEALPLTPNGKLDRKALPAPDDSAYARRTYEVPQGEVEQILARIWSEVLRIERVGRHDNFFELGGHSLLMVGVIDRMRAAGLRADVRTLFTAPTLVELAGAVRPEAQTITIPPNGIVAGSETITPQMLPLIALSAEQIAGIVANVPGGARNVQDIYPLAPLQEGILFHHLLADEGDPYVLYAMFRFDSRERMEQYLAALQAVIDRHDILRTSVVWEGLPEAAQVVWRNAPLIVEEVSLDPADGEIAQQLAARYNPRHYRLDVRRAPMMHVACAQENSGDWVMVQLFHHLVLDHTTLDIVQHEIDAYLHGSEAQLPEPLPFRTLVAHARLGVSREEHETFFRTMLQDVSEPTLPFGLADVQGDGRGIVQAYHPVASSLSKRLRACARRLGVSAASVCHVAWARVLAVLCSRDDVVFGTMLFGRMHGGAGVDRAVGIFMNALPFRVKTDISVEVCVRRTHDALAQLMYHEHAPLALAQRCSGVAAPTPLFSALLNYRHTSLESVNRVRPGIDVLGAEDRTNFPLMLAVEHFGDDLAFQAQADESVGAQRTCEYMHRALEGLVDALERSPEKALSTLRILPEAERQQVLAEWNATQRPYRSDVCIHELFEEQVAHTPDAVAVVYEDAQLSYAELNARANRLAHHLRSLGVGPESRVALCLERSVEMVVSLLAVLKAGGAYVPLDPSYPLDRLTYMLTDAAPAVVLTHGLVAPSVQAVLNRGGAPIIAVDQPDRWSDASVENPARGMLTPAHLAYVMYTSGSTGHPKGVMTEHRALSNRLCWMQRAYGLVGDDVVLQKTPLSFDVSVWECFWPLLQGATLAVARADGHKDVEYLSDVIGEQQVTTLHFVPSMLQLFLMSADVSSCASLRRVICSGEALPSGLVRRFHENFAGVELHNLYGPTEAAIDVTWWPCAVEAVRESIPIGRPIDNTRIYIVDEYMEPVPIGVAGELLIGGIQVARGYWNRAELTAQQFITSPFVEGDRLYRTGDVARYLPDGNIEFLGRHDFQVKIRGFRIELGEIESCLARYAGIRDAVVVAREDGGEKRLVAYYVAQEGAREIEAEQLRAHLQHTLPDYMVPAAYVALEAVPLTPNGKVDRKGLPAPGDSAYARRAYEAPQGEAEQTLALIWSEELGVEQVGRHDNFFALGGHSLLMVRVIDRLRGAGLHADVRTLFTASTLVELAGAVRPEAQTITIPLNGIVAGTETITPEMLSLWD